jgi:hypothetical protein
MTGRQFRDLFASAAKEAGWVKSAGGWVFPRLAGDQCATSIGLQQASHEKKMYCNIGVHVDGVFGRRFGESWQPEETHPHVFRREPKDLSQFLDFAAAIDDDQRSKGLQSLFSFLSSFATRARTRTGLFDLEKDGLVFILPPIRSELDQMKLHEI